jgi:hypothetical protein
MYVSQMSIDIFCLPLSTLVLSSFMTWYGLWMSNTMDTSIESGSPFPSRAHEFSLCYQWGSYWLFCLPTCFRIFSHISYIHVKPCSILLYLDLCCHGFMFYLMLHYISIYLRILVSNAISISTDGHSIFVLCSVWIVCLFCVPSIPLDCMPFDFQLMITPYCIVKLSFSQKRTWHFGRWTNICVLTHITRYLKTIWTYNGILI